MLADTLSDATINALAQTSHRFYATFNYALYSRNAHECNSLALQWAAFHGVVAPIFHALPYKDVMNILMGSSKVTIPVDALFRFACEKQSVDVLKQLLKQDPDQNTTDEMGSTWLHVAATHGPVDIVRLLLKRKDIRVDQKRLDGLTPLLCAIEGKRKAAANALLRAGANVNVTTTRGWSALCYACQSGNVSLVDELLRRGADIRISTNTAETVLHLACREGNPKIVQALLAHGSDPVLPAARTYQTALHIACRSCQEDIVRLLLVEIPHGHVTLRTGRTPLHEACEHGADAGAELEDGTTPLVMASHGGHYLVAKILLERGANPLQRISSGTTMLHIACERNTAHGFPFT